MSTVTTLIRPAEVIGGGQLKQTPLNARFDASVIAPWIHFAEKRFLLEPKSFMCQEFYDDLLAQRNVDDTNYNIDCGPIVLMYPSNAEYETLWTQHLYPYLALAAYHTALPAISMQTGSNGLFYNNTEFSQNAGADGLKLMQDTMMQNLDDAKACMVNFLCQNQANYPLFCHDDYCTDCGDGDEGLVKGRDLGLIFY
jgi:hypothetical protein